MRRAAQEAEREAERGEADARVQREHQRTRAQRERGITRRTASEKGTRQKRSGRRQQRLPQPRPPTRHVGANLHATHRSRPRYTPPVMAVKRQP